MGFEPETRLILSYQFLILPDALLDMRRDVDKGSALKLMLDLKVELVMTASHSGLKLQSKIGTILKKSLLL